MNGTRPGEFNTEMHLVARKINSDTPDIYQTNKNAINTKIITRKSAAEIPHSPTYLKKNDATKIPARQVRNYRMKVISRKSKPTHGTALVKFGEKPSAKRSPESSPRGGVASPLTNPFRNLSVGKYTKRNPYFARLHYR